MHLAKRGWNLEITKDRTECLPNRRLFSLGSTLLGNDLCLPGELPATCVFYLVLLAICMNLAICCFFYLVSADLGF